MSRRTGDEPDCARRHRARTPEQTWQVLEPELERLGITRVARLTDLDYLGIPVWTAIRPHSHTLVTSQGKGANDELAKISAVLEAAELWHAEQPLTVAVLGSTPLSLTRW